MTRLQFIKNSITALLAIPFALLLKPKEETQWHLPKGNDDQLDALRYSMREHNDFVGEMDRSSRKWFWGEYKKLPKSHFSKKFDVEHWYKREAMPTEIYCRPKDYKAVMEVLEAD